MNTPHHLPRAVHAGLATLAAALALAGTAPAQAADAGAKALTGTAAAAGDTTPVAKAARGRYLVMTSGCMDCHTPFKMGANGPEWDMARLLSGHPENVKMTPPPALPEGPWLVISSATNTAHAGPWGVSFTANLTPDPDTGLGQWTERDFIATIRTGRHLGRGREVLPPMPIPVYNNFSDEDLGSIYAFLRTIPPVKNRVPEPWAPTKAAAQK